MRGDRALGRELLGNLHRAVLGFSNRHDLFDPPEAVELLGGDHLPEEEHPTRL